MRLGGSEVSSLTPRRLSSLSLRTDDKGAPYPGLRVVSNRELCHWPVRTGDASYDRGRKTEERPAPSTRRRGLLGSVSCTLLVHPCSCLSGKNRLVTNGVHVVRELIFSKRRQCRMIKTDPGFPCFEPFSLSKDFFFASLLSCTVWVTSSNPQNLNEAYNNSPPRTVLGAAAMRSAPAVRARGMNERNQFPASPTSP